MSDPAPKFHGHRQRLRERFVKAGLDGMAEHQELEPGSSIEQPAGGSLRSLRRPRGVARFLSQ
ncbi:MAG: hypothetical protein KJZ81_18635 [Burkholderiaceae bacterium]|nr:hypothetical protein [Burkholderiaceae bacterium]